MKAEKIILSFIAILIGLLVAGVAFYLYQSTKVLPETGSKIAGADTSPTPTPETSNTDYLTVDEPKDEMVTDKRSVSVSGKTRNDATIIVSSEDGDDVAKPASDGSFTLVHTIGNGTTLIKITAVFADGSEKAVERTVTFSTEDF